MPEGDAIRAVAGLLWQRLGERTLLHGAVRRGRTARLDGAVVRAIQARGKHLLLHFERAGEDLGVRVHLGLGGRWHRYRPAARWRSPRDPRVGIVLATDADVLVCLEPARLHLGTWAEVLAHPALARLGPDILDDPCPVDAAVAGARRQPPGRAVLTVLLDQGVACGIGNIAAHEALFAAGVHPAVPAGAVGADDWRRLYAAAGGLLRDRVAVGGAGARARPAVYGRGGEPCRGCGGPVRAVRRGLHGRPSAWCPACQPEPGPTGVDAPGPAE